MMLHGMQRLAAAGSPPVVRCFHRGALVCMANRTGSHMIDHDPTSIQAAKDKALRGQSPAVIPTTEGWSQDLASASEAVVKAERAPELSIEDMQAYTVEVVKQVHDGKVEVRTGRDITGQPSVQENLHYSATDPKAQGYRQEG